MAKVKQVQVYIDPIANTFNIWWDDPKKAYSSEEVESLDRNDVIVKDKKGQSIGLEVIGIFPSELNIAEKIQKNLRQRKEPLLLQTI